MRKKEEIREEIRRKLSQHDSKDASLKSQRIHKALYKLEEFSASSCLLIYLSKQGEVDTIPVVERCFAQAKRVVVPKVIDKGTLELRCIRSLSECKPGTLGILEPIGSTPLVEPGEIDCAVLPGLAFDLAGHRLGKGKGYFDRLLKRLPKDTKRIALAFEFQVIEHVPHEEWDEKVDIVLSS